MQKFVHPVFWQHDACAHSNGRSCVESVSILMHQLSMPTLMGNGTRIFIVVLAHPCLAPYLQVDDWLWDDRAHQGSCFGGCFLPGRRRSTSDHTSTLLLGSQKAGAPNHPGIAKVLSASLQACASSGTVHCSALHRSRLSPMIPSCSAAGVRCC